MTIEKEVAFDPYHKWLGIPKAQRPPTLYQLLGLAQGETDGEVIEEAAIRQTTHLRAYQVGAHADDCTKLLNEVSSARQVLANPQKRQEYDAKLAQLAAKRAAAQDGNGAAKPVVPAATVVESAFADLSDDEATGPAVKPRRDAAKPNKSGKRPASKAAAKGIPQNMILAAAAGGGVLVVGLVAIIAVLVSPPPPPLPPVPVPPVVANNNPPPKVQPPPVVVNPPPKVDPKPPIGVKPPVDPNPLVKNPAGGGLAMPLLGSFALRTPPKNLIALADGRVFFGETEMHVYDPGRAQPLLPMNVTDTGPKGLHFALSPDGKTFYAGIPDISKLAAFRLYGAQIALMKPSDAVSTMNISPDGSTLVTGTYNGNVHLWNLTTFVRSPMAQSHGPRPVELAVFSRDGSLVATASEKSIITWNARENRIIGGAANGQRTTSMAFAPDGQNLLVASAAGLQSTPVTRNTWTQVNAGREGILRVLFVSDTLLAVLRPEGVEIYEWPTLRIVRQVHVESGDCDTLAAAPDGKVLFVGLTGPKMLAFGIENDAVLKPYAPGGEMPVAPPPTGGNPFVGIWQFQTKPTGSTKVNVVVRDNKSALLEIHKGAAVYKAHVDSLRSENGKLLGPILLDTTFPLPWTNLAEMTVDPPIGNTMKVFLRGDRQTFYSLQRLDGGDVPMVKNPPLPPPVPKADPTPVERVDAPSEDKIKEIAATIRDTYKDEYAKKSPTERADFAELLLKLALDSKNNPAERYVLCCEARDMAASAGKWSIVADAFDQLEAGFKVDLLPQKEAALQVLLKAGPNKESATEATEAALLGMNDAIAANQLPLAASFFRIAKTASAKSLNLPSISLANRAEVEMKRVTEEAEAANKAREDLKTKPDDPAANLVVGRYDGLRRGDWNAAIPLLAKGSDTDLAQVARKELEAPKNGAGQQKEVGDEWWALAEKEKDSTWLRSAIQNRAAHWYRRAAGQVTGLALTLVNERLKSIDEAPSPFRVANGGSTELRTLRGHTKAVTSLHLTTDGKRIFSGSLDATVKSWDLKLAKNLTTFPTGQPIYGLAFSPNSRYLALEFKDTVKVVDIADPSSKKNLPTGNGNALPGAYWVDDDRIAWIGPSSHSSVPIVGFGNSAGHSMRISAVQASPNHQQVITIGEETWLCETNPNGMLLQRSKTPIGESTSAVFSPTRLLVAVATADKKIALYDLQTRTITMTLEGAASPAHCMAYLPAGDRLLSAGDDGVVHLWDVSTGKEVRHFSTGAKGVSSMIVTPDGKQIITGGVDGVIRVWAMPREKLSTKTAALAVPASNVPTAPILAAPDPAPIVMAKNALSSDPPAPPPLSAKHRTLKDYYRVRQSRDWGETRNALAEALENVDRPEGALLLQLAMLEELNGRPAQRETLARRTLDRYRDTKEWQFATFAGRSYVVSPVRKLDEEFIAQIRSSLRDAAGFPVNLFIESLIEYRHEHFKEANELARRSFSAKSDYPEGNLRLAIALAEFGGGNQKEAREQLQLAKRWQIDRGAAGLGDGTGYEFLLLLREAESLMPGVPAAPHTGNPRNIDDFGRIVASRDWRECQAALEEAGPEGALGARQLSHALLKELNGDSAGRDAIAADLMAKQAAEKKFELASFGARSYLIAPFAKTDPERIRRAKEMLQPYLTRSGVVDYSLALADLRMKDYASAILRAQRSATRGFPIGRSLLIEAIAEAHRGNERQAKERAAQALEWFIDTGNASSQGAADLLEFYLLVREARNASPALAAILQRIAR
jgi:WD40 repeat protein